MPLSPHPLVPSCILCTNSEDHSQEEIPGQPHLSSPGASSAPFQMHTLPLGPWSPDPTLACFSLLAEPLLYLLLIKGCTQAANQGKRPRAQGRPRLSITSYTQVHARRTCTATSPPASLSGPRSHPQVTGGGGKALPGEGGSGVERGWGEHTGTVLLRSLLPPPQPSSLPSTDFSLTVP